MRGVSDSLAILRTKLSAADKLIVYRILECGVRFRQLDSQQKKNKFVVALTREAVTVLHIRIEDPKTGIVTWVGDISGEASDEVKPSDLKFLESGDLIFYEHGLPNINKNMPR